MRSFRLESSEETDTSVAALVGVLLIIAALACYIFVWYALFIPLLIPGVILFIVGAIKSNENRVIVKEREGMGFKSEEK